MSVERELENSSKPEIILSDEQKQVFEDIDRGSNVLVTGCAGTGKSVLIGEIKKKYPNVVITGTTGVSAVNIGGVTLHSWSGVTSDPTIHAEFTAKSILNNPSKKKQLDSIKNCEMLIIDEVSMLDSVIFEKVGRILQLVRGSRKPFGDIQVLLFGDFLQLPPVPNKDVYGNRVTPKFCFQTETWNILDIQMYLLTKVFRQSNIEFVNMLNRIRKNTQTIEDINILMDCLNRQTPKDTIKVFSKNKDVDMLNKKMVDSIDGKSFFYEKKDVYFTDDEEEIKSLKKTLKEGCLAPDVLELKLGVRVMMLRNYLQDYGIVNGSIGTVVGFDDEYDYPIVEFDNGEVKKISTQKWELRIGGEVLAYRIQMPLKPAYAITIHKSQGMTLDRIECDLEDCWDYSQIYVALSRVKNLSGLYLNSFNPNKIKAHPTALYFYEVIEQLMEQLK